MKRDTAMLLGFTVPDAMAREFFARDPLPAVQTHKFAWSLTRALRHAHREVRLLSAAPVQSFPLFPRLRFRSHSFREYGVEGQLIGFLNLIVLKHATRFFGIVRAWPQIVRWRVETVYVHGVHTPFLLAGLLLKARGLRVIAVLTDPPGVSLPTDGWFGRLLKAADRALAGMIIRRFSGVVALAPELAAQYAEGLPALVVPGIVGVDWLAQLATLPSGTGGRDRPVVLYAGGLQAAYGVDRLIDSAELMPDVDFLFYGKGDQVERLTSAAPANARYEGFVDAPALAKAIRHADILVNPRPTGSRMAAQSFPSKLLEYLACGKPVLTTRLDAIPPEIAGCFDYLEDETASGIAAAIRRVLATPRDRSAVPALVDHLFGEAALGRKLIQWREQIT